MTMLKPLPLRRAMRHRLPSDFPADSGPQWFPSGFPVCPSAFPVVSQWLPSRFPVASQCLPDGSPVASQWLPGGFPVASQSLEIRCTHCSSERSGGSSTVFVPIRQIIFRHGPDIPVETGISRSTGRQCCYSSQEAAAVAREQRRHRSSRGSKCRTPCPSTGECHRRR